MTLGPCSGGQIKTLEHMEIIYHPQSASNSIPYMGLNDAPNPSQTLDRG